jgi:hypothetical protein
MRAKLGAQLGDGKDFGSKELINQMNLIGVKRGNIERLGVLLHGAQLFGISSVLQALHPQQQLLHGW